jgi:uncharacterized OB-fold protein
MSEPVKRILAPVRLTYSVSAGRDKSTFLRAILDGRIVGGRCPSCRKVYVPPRGCPTCGVETSESVQVSDRGVMTTFCTVNVPFEGQTMKLPYVYASIVLDGADVPIFHLVDGIDAADARMGLRVKADWRAPADRRPTMESIRAFVPTGEPDAPYDSYKEHL